MAAVKAERYAISAALVLAQAYLDPNHAPEVTEQWASHCSRYPLVSTKLIQLASCSGIDILRHIPFGISSRIVEDALENNIDYSTWKTPADGKIAQVDDSEGAEISSTSVKVPAQKKIVRRSSAPMAENLDIETMLEEATAQEAPDEIEI